MEHEKKKRTGIYLVVGCVALLTILVLCAAYLRPLDRLVQLPAVKEALTQRNTVSCQLPNGQSGTLDLTPEMKSLMDVDSWRRTWSRPKGTAVLTLVLGELWELEIYADGKALVVNGYAPIHKTGSAYYFLPEGLVDALRSHCEANSALMDP